MEWMFLPFRRYAEFGGRSRRKEYWMFTLLGVLVAVAMRIVFGDGSGLGLSVTGTIINGLWGLGSFIPSLAVAFRRLHDTDHSAWWLLLWLVPIVGWIVLLVFLCRDGTGGTNRFGHDPKQRDLGDVFS